MGEFEEGEQRFNKEKGSEIGKSTQRNTLTHTTTRRDTDFQQTCFVVAGVLECCTTRQGNRYHMEAKGTIRMVRQA